MAGTHRSARAPGTARDPERAVRLPHAPPQLALSIAKRPGGLLAAKVALKPISVATTERYTVRPGVGGSQRRRRNVRVLPAPGLGTTPHP
ncbi:hypothetical protein [Streptomyces microflavus]|uniref:hypothetical protein n=1 Tax=Streptomyces microflavus TaxID=1919 RepID=UPI00380B238C